MENLCLTANGISEDHLTSSISRRPVARQYVKIKTKNR